LLREVFSEKRAGGGASSAESSSAKGAADATPRHAAAAAETKTKNARKTRRGIVYVCNRSDYTARRLGEPKGNSEDPVPPVAIENREED
jgi:hypothetical protein